MSKIELLPHNEEGYDELIGALEHDKFVSLNRATGTGKSFILLKFLYENRNKRILYLAPTYPIIDQLLENHAEELGIDVKDFKKFDTKIYTSLLREDINKLAQEYDIFIFDEYHRCGAKKWGEKINQLLSLLKQRSDAIVIGTTATEIRYLDKEKNMNNILFDGVCASELSLSDAILRGILPVPIYINAVYDLIERLNLVKARLQKYCLYPEMSEKYNLQVEVLEKQINNLVKEKMAFDSYLPESGKYLVFSNKIDDIKKNKKVIASIFKGKEYSEYEVHSKFTKVKNKKTLDEFRNRSNSQNSILYSVKILDEGIHVKNVDGIFMLRNTKSPIIYFQQLGRLLSFSSRKKRKI